MEQNPLDHNPWNAVKSMMHMCSHYQGGAWSDGWYHFLNPKPNHMYASKKIRYHIQYEECISRILIHLSYFNYSLSIFDMLVRLLQRKLAFPHNDFTYPLHEE